MKLSVIIPTLNRYKTLNHLIEQLDNLGNRIEEIIIIDSTDEENRKIIYPASKLRYFTTNHKNGLFQRYAGYVVAKSEWLLFLDNDMELIGDAFLSEFEQLASRENISGIAFRIQDKHPNTSLASIPKHLIFTKKSSFKSFLSWFTGYSKLPPGKLGFCGNRGKQPQDRQNTEWLSGGAFAAKKEYLFYNFNFQLFNLFEKKLGMGEDVLFGYGLSKKGDLVYSDKLLFYHNDQKDSAYSTDHFAYSRRVIFSRLHLSMEKARLDGTNLIWPKLFYHWFVFWRLVGLFFNFIIDPSVTRKKLLLGGLKGWGLIFTFKYPDPILNKEYWQKEAKLI